MELGGGVRLRVDTCGLLWPISSSLSPLQKVSERVVRSCCVHETLSAAFVTRSLRVSTHPLLRGAEIIIARDEARRRLEPLLNTLISHGLAMDFSHDELRDAFEKKLREWKNDKGGQA